MKQLTAQPSSFAGSRTVSFLQANSVLLVFLILTVAEFLVSGATSAFFLQEIVTRFTRNGFLVLSLIIPVVAGIGLNFGIVIGAMAGQMAMIHAVSWNFSGFTGFLFCLLFSTPIAILFGFLTAKVLNRCKGNEMIASMILGYLANGIYQFFYLILIGAVIPFPKEEMLLQSGVGLLATCSLEGTLKYSLNDVWKTSLGSAAAGALVLVMVWMVLKLVRAARRKELSRGPVFKTAAVLVLCAAALAVIRTNQSLRFTLDFVDISISCLIMIVLLCLFNQFILKTKLGQDFRTVGQSQQVAEVAGIHVDRTRTIAIIFSTVFAAWGQIIHLQDIGTINVYSNHEQVGLLAVAAILVGGASVERATNRQAIIGVLLFHAMFCISPLAGVALFSDEQIGEFFRVFIAYGVIFLSLALNAIRNRAAQRRLSPRGGVPT